MLKMAIKNAFGRARRRPWAWGSAVGEARLAAVDQADFTAEDARFVRSVTQGMPNWAVEARLPVDAGGRVLEQKEDRICRYALRRSADGGNGGWINIQVHCISVSPGERPRAQISPSDWSGLAFRSIPTPRTSVSSEPAVVRSDSAPRSEGHVTLNDQRPCAHFCVQQRRYVDP